MLLLLFFFPISYNCRGKGTIVDALSLRKWAIQPFCYRSNTITSFASINSRDGKTFLRSTFKPGEKDVAKFSKNPDLTEHAPYFPSTKNDKSQQYKTKGLKFNRIPDDVIQRIKDEADIVSVIESHNLPLFTRTGPNKAKALCPFHDDNNPSLSIDGDKQLFKCFSCGQGGDVFSFVREYRHLKDGGEKMSFVDSVRLVAEEFTDGTAYNFYGKGLNTRVNMTDAEFAKFLAREEKKKRIYLANAAAADFFGKNLITLPSAGMARRHLQSRDISPGTVRRFALGYAPETYFNLKNREERGRGSLVHRLKDLGFTVQEIIDAGLATKSNKNNKWKKRNDAISAVTNVVNISLVNQTRDQKNINVTTNETSLDEDYDELMDRFRGRVMVPIFDSDGRNIIAFGGRHLDNPLPSSKKNTTGNFKAAKYLNSPESLVFQKKKVLFGFNEATKQMNERDFNLEINQDLDPDSDENIADLLSRSTFDEKPAVNFLIVEGYFDALALYDAGVKYVTASMGTALTKDQLEMVAQRLGKQTKGKIVLCLDNDAAGLNAIERLCDSSILMKVSEKKTIQILIAQLPENTKDPAEFIEHKGGGNQAGESFNEEIVSKAIPWSDWFINRIVSQYDSNAETGTNGSFSDICSRISDFLSTFPNAADRTRRSYDVAIRLANLISNDSSPALRIQLESDLLDMSSRKAQAREALTRRVENVDGLTDLSNSNVVAKLASGEGVATNYDEGKQVPTNQIDTKKHFNKKWQEKDATNFSFSKSRVTKQTKRESSPILPHFSGFEFDNPEDAVWLGLAAEKSKRKKSDLILGHAVYNVKGGGKFGKNKNKDVVFFNSNQYLGQGETSRNAALKSKMGRNNEDFQKEFLKIYSAAVEQNTDRVIEVAEKRLLNTLIYFQSARQAMKMAVRANIKGEGDCNKLLEWTSKDREWLFDRLIDTIGDEVLPASVQNDVPLLRDYLASSPNAPDGAFGDILSSQNNLQQNQLKDSNMDLQSNGSNIDYDSLDSIPSDSDDVDACAASYDPTDDLNISLEQDSNADNDLIDKPEEKSKKVKIGSLDSLFEEVEDELENIDNREERAELTVQETVAVMLRSSAMKRKAQVLERWKDVTNTLIRKTNERKFEELGDETNSTKSDLNKRRTPRGIEMYESMNIEELKPVSDALSVELAEVSKAVIELDTSARRISKRLLEFSVNAMSSESREAKTRQKALEQELKDHMENLPAFARQPESPGDDGDYVFGVDSFSEQYNPMLGGKNTSQNNSPNFNIFDEKDFVSEEDSPTTSSTIEDDYLESETYSELINSEYGVEAVTKVSPYSEEMNAHKSYNSQDNIDLVEDDGMQHMNEQVVNSESQLHEMKMPEFYSAEVGPLSDEILHNL